MTSAELIPAAILQRKAVVYVRQSTQSQVMINLESKQRQYDLVDVARQRGFVDVEIIDDDLGRSASGTVARPGFDRLVAWLCAGEVGAVVAAPAAEEPDQARFELITHCRLLHGRRASQGHGPFDLGEDLVVEVALLLRHVAATGGDADAAALAIIIIRIIIMTSKLIPILTAPAT